MRWIPFIILAYPILLVQTTLGRVLIIHSDHLGAVWPDFLAILAVFVALRAKALLDVMLAAWTLGLLVDLTTAGGPGGAAVIGPMAIAYTFGAFVVYRVREAFFREHRLPQVLLTFVFCLLAHWLWVTIQSLLAGGMSFSIYTRVLLQVVLVSAYTAALMLLGHPGLARCQRFFLTVPSGRSRRAGRR
ncbi:MAG: hypothetical protein KAU28_03035 [Phycisphaerae bacterium]|nr:hypothetical protein [Phycisphaerae bacterium]